MTSTRRVLPWLLVLAVLVAAVGLGWVGWNSHHGAAQTADADLPGTGVLDAATIGRSTPSPARPAPSLPLSPADAIRQTRAEIAARHEQAAHVMQQARQDAAAAFAREPVDPTWSSSTEHTLERVASSPAIQQNVAQPRSLQVECRSSMCRLTSDFGNSSQADDWTLLFMASVGANMPHAIVSRVVNPDGSQSVVIYSRVR